jgi:plasmid stability protein
MSISPGRQAALGLCLCTATILHAATPAELLPAVAEPPVVEIRGDTVYYTGGFKVSSMAVFDTAVAPLRRGQVTRLVLRSGGGDTVAGRNVGRWVRAMALVVEVDQICFSSCADYVFPAGRARVIRANAFVGWHGNERQMLINAARHGGSVEQEFERLLPAELTRGGPAQTREVVATLTRQWRDQSLPDEQAFYRELNLDDAFAVCAVGDVLGARAKPTTKGWGFSLADMARLGMPQTVYLGDGTYERDSVLFQTYLVPITADECMSLLK